MKKEVFRFSLKMNFGLFKSVAAFLRYFMSGQSTPISLMTNVCNILTMPVEVKISWEPNFFTSKNPYKETKCSFE